PPFKALYKANLGYSLPWNVNASLTFQARPGISIGSAYTYTCTAAQAAQTGCTALTAGVSSLSVTVIDPTKQYYSYVKTVDTRFSKTIRYGRARVEPFVEIFNLPNFSTILTVNETVGPNYFTPGSIVQGRRFQLGVRAE